MAVHENVGWITNGTVSFRGRPPSRHDNSITQVPGVMLRSPVAHVIVTFGVSASSSPVPVPAAPVIDVSLSSNGAEPGIPILHVNDVAADRS